MVRPKDPVLLQELLDNVLLIAAHPSRQRHYQELKGKCIHGYKRTMDDSYPPNGESSPGPQLARIRSLPVGGILAHYVVGGSTARGFTPGCAA
jgi:hypothetical protein